LKLIQTYRESDNLVEYLKRLVGVIADVEEFRETTLQNSWTVTSGKVFNFYKDPYQIVHINGRLTPGTETDNTLIFTLPSGYRPRVAMSYIVVTNVVGGAGGRFFINTDGQVTCTNLDTGGGFYDINISFRAV
jgi:hypothetical protein